MVRSPHGENTCPSGSRRTACPQARKNAPFPEDFSVSIPGRLQSSPCSPGRIRPHPSAGAHPWQHRKIHLLLLRVNADAEQGRLNDMNPGLIILADFRSRRGISGAYGITRLVFRHRSGEIRYADNTGISKTHAESYFGNRIRVLPFDETPRRGGVFRLSGMLETEHIEAGRKRGSKAFSPD